MSHLTWICLALAAVTGCTDPTTPTDPDEEARFRGSRLGDSQRAPRASNGRATQEHPSTKTMKALRKRPGALFEEDP
jgi:hypothetical protein